MGKYSIHVKNGFSERKGIIKFSDIVQIDTLNIRTRNKIYSAIQDTFMSLDNMNLSLKGYFCEYFYTEILSLTKNHIPRGFGGVSPYDYNEIFSNIYEIVMSYSYNEIFDLIEGMIKTFEYVDNNDSYKFSDSKTDFIKIINNIFLEENVNYKIISGIITDLVGIEEVKSIDETISNSNKVVSDHFQKAIELLYKSKDYENSIKESITAVEAMCQIITGKDKAILSDGLKKLKKEIHPALKIAFEKLYAYTSDANGIRHANGIGEGDSSFSEARYMLISCSAFINYLSENSKLNK